MMGKMLNGRRDVLNFTDFVLNYTLKWFVVYKCFLCSAFGLESSTTRVESRT